MKTNIEKVQEYISRGKIVSLKKYTGIPVDAEKEFNQLGMSAGFVHLKNIHTGNIECFCGVNYFLENVK